MGLTGIFARWLNESLHFANCVYPGIYAMVGAAAVLGGVCRVTISLTVIMFELTSSLQLIIPFMFAVLIAKAVGDWFTGAGIYDLYILLRGYPFLEEPSELTFNQHACDLIAEEEESELEIVHLNGMTLAQLKNQLDQTVYGGFPIITDDRTLIGYVSRQDLSRCVKEQLTLFDENTVVSFDKASSCRVNFHQIVDTGVMRIVPETPLAQVHNIFRQLGVKLILIVRGGTLVKQMDFSETKLLPEFTEGGNANGVVNTMTVM